MKKTSINIISALLLQLVIILNGLIVPKLILDCFGSEVNGLISSLTQFLNYIILFEGGVGDVVVSCLYKPVANKDNYKISSVIKSAKSFFHKIAYIFLAYQLILAIVYPFFIKTSFNWAYVFSLTLILSINLFMQYFFSISWKLLLKADQKVYISSYIQIVAILLNAFGTILVIKAFPNVHIVKLFTSIVYVLQPILFGIYGKKHYNINKEVPADTQALNQRWDGFGITLASFIHKNTDVIILTFFSTLNSVSVYTVYMFVVNGLKSLIISISSGMIPLIGNLYAKNECEKLNSAFDLYEFIICTVSFLSFAVCVNMITPFVIVYTKGINDANYFQPVFAVLLIISELTFCIREPFSNMTYAAGHFRRMSKIAYAEAILNLILSVIFVINFDIIGVAIGTLIAMSLRTIFQVDYISKNILYRKKRKFYKTISILSSAFVCSVMLNNCFMIVHITSWISWFIQAMIAFVITLSIFIVFIIFFQRNELICIYRMLRKGEKNVRN